MDSQKGSEIVGLVGERTGILLEELKGCADLVKKDTLLLNYLNSCYFDKIKGQNGEDGDKRFEVKGKNGLYLNFDSDIEWMDPIEPNLKSEESNHMFVVEFFTHCCINCTHSMQDLRRIHGELKEERIDNKTLYRFLAIHSPKFTRERNHDSIHSFIQKYQLNHANVLNDPKLTFWENLGIFCWPTILIFGPNINPPSECLFKPNLLFVFYGENYGEEISWLLKETLKYFDERLPSFDPLMTSLDVPDGLPLRLKPPKKPPQSFLKYPGKVAIYDKDSLAISDSGNHRLILTTTNGTLKAKIGGTVRGYRDGDFIGALFDNPQGLVFNASGSKLYVCDTGNHAVRVVDLTEQKVTTLVNKNATIGEDQTILKSPWDLCFYSEDILLIAGAGSHQIFGYFFKSSSLFGISHTQGSFDLIAGSGKEENRNNSYILKSSFAQPSGLATSQATGNDEDGGVVYIADSESSSIRCISPSGKVLPIVGASKNPSDLFAFGDKDGIAYEVRLQHPMGVCLGLTPQEIYIADTYNNKIKIINVETKLCRTLIGGGKAGDKIGSFIGNTELSPALINEPGGLCIHEPSRTLFIADTNNNKIKIADLESNTVTELSLSDAKKVDASFQIRLPTKQFSFKLLNLPESFEGGEWGLIAGDERKLQTGSIEYNSESKSGQIKPNELQLDLQMKILYLNLVILYCKEECCLRKSLTISFNLIEDDSTGQEPVNSFELQLTPHLLE